MTGPLWKPKKRAPSDQGRGRWSRHRKRYLEKQVKENGWYECNLCHKWVQNPEVDHIIKRSVRPDLKYVESNFQILCHDCHMRKDSGMRYKEPPQ